MAQFTSPYSDLTYSKGPKTLYFKEEGVFEVVLNVPQTDDDDEWGRTLVIGQRQTIDKVTDILVDLYGIDGTYGIDADVTALKKVVKLNNAVYTEGTTSGVELSIGDTVIEHDSAVFGGSLSVSGDSALAGSLSVVGDFSIGGDISQGQIGTNAKLGTINANGLVVCGTVYIQDGSLTTTSSISAGSLSVSGSTTLNENTTINASTTINGDIIQGQPEELGYYNADFGNIYAQSSTFRDSVSITEGDRDPGNLTVEGEITAGSLEVSGGTTLNSLKVGDGDQFQVNISGDITTSGKLTVSGSVDLDSTLTVDGITYLEGGVNIGSSVNTQSYFAGYITFFATTLDFQGANLKSTNGRIDFDSEADLYVGGSLNVDGAIDLSGATTVSNTLAVSGDATFTGSVDLHGVTFSSGTDIGASNKILNIASVNAVTDVKLGRNLEVGNDVSVLASLRACGTLESDNLIYLSGKPSTYGSYVRSGDSAELAIWYDGANNKVHFVDETNSLDVTLDLNDGNEITVT